MWLLNALEVSRVIISHPEFWVNMNCNHCSHEKPRKNLSAMKFCLQKTACIHLELFQVELGSEWWSGIIEVARFNHMLNSGGVIPSLIIISYWLEVSRLLLLENIKGVVIFIKEFSCNANAAKCCIGICQGWNELFANFSMDILVWSIDYGGWEE